MKTVRRIIALVGVVGLVALYVSALVLAVIGSERSLRLFLVAIVATVILPVLLWAYQFIYNLLGKYYSTEAREETEKMRRAAEQGKTAAEENDSGDNRENIKETNSEDES